MVELGCKFDHPNNSDFYKLQVNRENPTYLSKMWIVKMSFFCLLHTSRRDEEPWLRVGAKHTLLACLVFPFQKHSRITWKTQPCLHHRQRCSDKTGGLKYHLTLLLISLCDPFVNPYTCSTRKERLNAKTLLAFPQNSSSSWYMNMLFLSFPLTCYRTVFTSTQLIHYEVIFSDKK